MGGGSGTEVHASSVYCESIILILILPFNITQIGSLMLPVVASLQNTLYSKQTQVYSGAYRI